MSKRFYFAYGSNMDEQQMSTRCPGAVVEGTAKLRDHRFMINVKGFATVVREQSGEVFGVLWSLTPADEASLDAYEGIATGLYWKTTIDVEVKTESVRALIYVAGNSRFGSPRKDYINKLIAAAERHQLPATYIGKLRAWL